MNRTYLIEWGKFFQRVARTPLSFLSIIYLIKFCWLFVEEKYHLQNLIPFDLSFYLISIAQVITIYWICINLIHQGSQRLLQWGSSRNNMLLLTIIPPIISSLEGALFLVMINMLTYSLRLENDGIGLFVEKAAQVLLIAVIAWIIYHLISGIESYITNRYILANKNLSSSRKLQTQITLLKRILGFFIILIALGSILMIFDNIRSIGTSLLTTAGIISAIGAFASQQSLGRIFAGLQLAFTQPIRIGDTVIIENEFGQVEEITLSFITIKLWDLRRLILPTDHFIQKGVLNLTLESSDLLGTIFLYADYTLPVEKIREQFLTLVHQSPLWNKLVAKLEITDIKEQTMEIRCLVSAANASDLWTLRCEIREKLIRYIVDNHYDCLTITRTLSVATES